MGISVVDLGTGRQGLGVQMSWGKLGYQDKDFGVHLGTGDGHIGVDLGTGTGNSRQGVV